ncbi:hypothetical protein ACGIF2_17445 [Cellulomonas sp. P22]|uniref:hypothetical protein n=1 Tax=Cellulomonas sp. P22 TaxID=3373189 RepID=UPI0037892659
MSDDEPEPGGTERATSTGARAPRRAARRWWGAAAVLVVAVGGSLLLRSWGDAGADPLPAGTQAHTSMLPSAPASTPAAEPLFDQAGLAPLFVTAAEVEATLPGAAGGVVQEVRSGELAWGLGEGRSVSPEGCTLAATVVADSPPGFDARAWGNGTVTFAEQAVLLPSVEAAVQAFRTLVATVDACPAYDVVGPDASMTGVVASPATEAQGIYPSLVQQTRQTTGADVVLALHGHVLVENVILTWTADAGPGADDQQLRDRLGAGEDIDTMVQEQARSAVAALHGDG